MRPSVTITGFRELDSKLGRLGRALPEKKQRETLEPAGELIAERARELVAVYRGDLHDNIGLSDKSFGGSSSIGGLGDGVVLFVGTRSGPGLPDASHGHMVERGTFEMPADPFMRPAFDGRHGRALEQLGSDLGRVVIRAARD